MTIKELEEYRSLLNEIEALNRQIESLYNTYHSPSTESASKSSGKPHSPTERALAQIQTLEQTYYDEINELQKKAHEIELWVQSIEDMFVRSCIRYHYLLGYSWKETSKKVYGYVSYYNARKIVYRYMGKEK